MQSIYSRWKACQRVSDPLYLHLLEPNTFLPKHLHRKAFECSRISDTRCISDSNLYLFFSYECLIAYNMELVFENITSVSKRSFNPRALYSVSRIVMRTNSLLDPGLEKGRWRVMDEVQEPLIGQRYPIAAQCDLSMQKYEPSTQMTKWRGIVPAWLI